MYKAIIVILICWLVVSVTTAWRIETYGACASSSCTKTLLYTQQHYHSNPALLRLTNSYKSWALGLIGTDAGNYLRTALSIAEGKGLCLKLISPDDPNNCNFLPYYFQGPGAPVIIGLVIKLFGAGSILPYFIFI